jgi:hypothetical protein
MADLTDLGPTCRKELHLTEPEHQQLRSLPDPLHALEQQVYCELEAGHAGPHMALAQSHGFGADETDWWFLWSPVQRQLRSVDKCLHQSADVAIDEEHGLCGLPTGHPSRHGFELEDPPGRAPSPAMQRILERLAAEQNW